MPIATMTRTDREIQTDVLSELGWDHSIQANEIGVAVKDGVVTLTGTVDTYLKKWKANSSRSAGPALRASHQCTHHRRAHRRRHCVRRGPRAEVEFKRTGRQDSGNRRQGLGDTQR